MSAGRGEELAGRIKELHREASVGEHVHTTESEGMDYCRICWSRGAARNSIMDLLPDILAALEAAARLPATPDPAIETLAKLYHAVSMTGFGHDVKAQKQRLADALKEAGTLLAESFPPDYAEACAIEGRREPAALATPSPQAPERCPTCTSSVRNIKAGLAYGVLEPGACPDIWHDGAATQEQPAGSGDAIRETAVAWLSEHKKAWSGYDLFSLIRIMQPSSPRKVGEDGQPEKYERTHSRVWVNAWNEAIARCAMTVCYGCESEFPFDEHDRHKNEGSYFPCRAREIRALKNPAAARPSSAPVGEQKQEEGV